MKTTRFTILYAMAAVFLAVSPQAAIGQEYETITNLFNRAVRATGPEYWRLKPQIMNRGTEGSAFLQTKTGDSDLSTRIIARAVLDWMEHPEANTNRSKLLGRFLLKAARSRGGASVGIQLNVRGYYSERDKTVDGRFPPDDELHENAAVPFLLEAALKGAQSLGEGEVTIPNYDTLARAFAAGALGGYEGADIIPTLKHLLTSSSDDIRTCAVIGLARTREPEAIDTLLGVMADQGQGEPVRDTAQRALAQLTGQEFGRDRGKYEDWWKKNRGQWSKTPK